MNIDTIRFSIQYFLIKADLIKQYDYTAKEAAETIADLRAMKPELLHAFILWFRAEQGSAEEKRLLSTIAAGGVSLQAIMQLHHLNPYAGFLALDWIAEDPNAALHTLRKPVALFELDAETEERLREIAQKRGIAIETDENVAEDTSDLVDPAVDEKKKD